VQSHAAQRLGRPSRLLRPTLSFAMTDKLNEAGSEGRASGPSNVVDAAHPRRGGKRRMPEQRPSSPLRWPTKPSDRYVTFRNWHAIAAQIIKRAGGQLDALGGFHAFINMQTGQLWPKNADLVPFAGGCCEKTVQRQITFYRRVGVITTRIVHRGRNKGTDRYISLAYPTDHDGDLMLPDDVSEKDQNCPG
jgi:hypothetical protein